ncbi:SapB/AmfS family lantipeptide [Nocardiopsis ansamitocini]|nr:SapB/AmfS family lantipeptide [Nocardiopsis ansamitocini]
MMTLSDILSLQELEIESDQVFLANSGASYFNCG